MRKGLVEDKFKQLKELNVKVKIYKIHSPVREEELIKFETNFKIKIPEEYRWFLLNLTEAITGNNPTWKNRVKEYLYDDILEKINFGLYYSSPYEFNPSIEFPADKKIVLYEEEEKEDTNEKNDIYQKYTNGCMVLLETGCGSYDFIVVNGKEHGNIWIENICSSDEVYPYPSKIEENCRISFFEWVYNQLELAVRRCEYSIEEKNMKDVPVRETIYYKPKLIDRIKNFFIR